MKIHVELHLLVISGNRAICTSRFCVNGDFSCQSDRRRILARAQSKPIVTKYHS